VVGVARQNEPVGQGFGLERVEIGHERGVRRMLGILNEKTPEKEGGFGNHAGTTAIAPVGIEPTTSRL
jgi:hypothetical protein